MKKAQLEMGETIFALIIIILLIMMGLIFAFRGEKATIEEKVDTLGNLDAAALAQVVANLPELIYSPGSVKQQSSFDKSKIEAFQKLIEHYPELSREYYFDKLGNVEIKIEQIYPVTEAEPIEIYLNDFDVDDIVMSFGTPVKIPTSIYDPVTNQYAFGVLYVTRYVRK
jgi:hypothetical protein